MVYNIVANCIVFLTDLKQHIDKHFEELRKDIRENTATMKEMLAAMKSMERARDPTVLQNNKAQHSDVVQSQLLTKPCDTIEQLVALNELLQLETNSISLVSLT